MNRFNGKAYIDLNSTTFMLVYGTTALDLSGAPTAITTTNLSTAVTGSTVLTAAVATAAELNKTNALIMEIRNMLVTAGLLSS